MCTVARTRVTTPTKETLAKGPVEFAVSFVDFISPKTRDSSLMRVQKANNAISHIFIVMQYKTL